MTRILHAILAAPTPMPTPAPAELPDAVAWAFLGLAASDWVTIGASLVVGLGAAGITTLGAAGREKKAREHAVIQLQEARELETTRLQEERTKARRIALRNYERVLRDLAVQGEHEYAPETGPGLGITDHPYAHMDKARADAYHYFDSFSEDEQRFLKYPYDEPELGEPPWAGSDRLSKAANIIKVALSEESSLTH